MKHTLATKLWCLLDEKVAKCTIEGTYNIPTDLGGATKLILEEIGMMGIKMRNEEGQEIMTTPDDFIWFNKGTFNWTKPILIYFNSSFLVKKPWMYWLTTDFFPRGFHQEWQHSRRFQLWQNTHWGPFKTSQASNGGSVSWHGTMLCQSKSRDHVLSVVYHDRKARPQCSVTNLFANYEILPAYKFLWFSDIPWWGTTLKIPHGDWDKTAEVPHHCGFNLVQL